MSVSPADFYAYAQATGTPVPKDKKSQAQLVPAVRQWRKSQLRAPQQQQRQQDEPDLGDALAWTGLGAGGLSAIGALVLRKPGVAAKISKQVSKTQQQIDATKEQILTAFKGTETGATTKLEDIQQTATAAKEDVDQVVKKTNVRREQDDIWDAQADNFVPSSTSEQVEAASFANKYADDVGLTDAERPTPLLQEAPYTGTGSTKINPQQILTDVQEAGGAVPYLKAAGLPNFEIDARMKAYAGSSTSKGEGNPIFLDPKFNANTVGITAFEDELGLRPNSSVANQQGHLITGEFANPLGEAPRVVRGGATEFIPEKEGFGVKDSNVSEYGTQGMQVTPRIPVRGSGTPTNDPQAFLNARLTNERTNEQWRHQNELFARNWDVLAGQGKVHPRTVRRQIDQIDLNLPWEQTYDDVGNVVEEVLYKDIIDPNLVNQVESGLAVEADVPYRINKARAVEDALREGYKIPYDPNSQTINQTLVDNANAYKTTGWKLAEIRDKYISEDLDNSRLTKRTLDSNQFFEETGESTNITPKSGPGSQKGNLTGGEVIPMPSRVGNVYNIELAPAIDKETGQQMIDRGGTRLWNPQIIDGKDSKQLNLLSQLGENNVIANVIRNEEYITTQPVATRVLKDPLGKIKRVGNKGKFYEVPTYFATTEYVDAPLQVLQLDKSGNVSNQLKGQINRRQIKESLLAIKQRAENEAKAGKALKRELVAYKDSHNKPVDKKYLMQLATDVANTYKISDVNRLLQATAKAPQTSGKGLAKELQKELANKQNIYLPVLDSAGAKDFVDDIIGYPKSTVPQLEVVAVQGSRKRPDGRPTSIDPSLVYPIKKDTELEQLLISEAISQRQFDQLTAPYGEYDRSAAGKLRRKSLQDPSLSRNYSGQQTEDKTQNPKDLTGAPSEIQVAEQGYEKNYAESLDELDTMRGYSGTVELHRNLPIGDRRSAEEIARDMNKKRANIGLLPNVTVAQAQKLKEQTSLSAGGYDRPVKQGGLPIPPSERKPRYTSGLVMDEPSEYVGSEIIDGKEVPNIISGKSKYVALKGPEQTSVMQRINESLISKGKKPLPEFSAETGVTFARDMEPQTVVREAQWTRRQTSGDNVLGETLSKVRRQLPQFSVLQTGQKFPKGPISQFPVDNRPKFDAGRPGRYMRYQKDDMPLISESLSPAGYINNMDVDEDIIQLGLSLPTQVRSSNLPSVDRESIIRTAPKRISVEQTTPLQGPRAYNPMGQYDSLFAQAKAKSRRRAGKKRGNR